MKKFFLIIIILSIGLTACNEWLEIEEQDVLRPEDALVTAEDYEKLINSAYDVLRGAGGNFLGGRSQIFSDLLSHQISENGLSGDYLAIYRRSPNFFNGSIGDYYKEPYITIFRANVLLEEIESVEGLEQSDIDRLKGEAYFLRALSHMDVLLLFAHPSGYSDDNSHPGISLRTEATQDIELRASFQDSFNQIEEDFEQAITLLGNGNDRGFGFATEWAAKAFLSRLYFFSNQYDEAYELANEVLESGNFSFDSNLSFRFSQGQSDEGVFVMPSLSNADHRGSGLTSNYRFAEGQEPTLKVSMELYDEVSSNEDDQRNQWFFLANEGTEDEEVYISKYNGMEYFDMPLIHVTELKLIRAESAALLNQNLDVAIADINDIRERAYGSSDENLITTAGAVQIINAARRERTIEMVTEGNYLHDMKRIGVLEESENVTIDGAIWSCPGLLLEFPTLESVEGFEPNNPNGC